MKKLYADPKQSIYGDINWAAVIAALAGLVAGWAWQYGLHERPEAAVTH